MKNFILIIFSIILTCLLWAAANNEIKQNAPEKKVLENNVLIDATIDVEFINSLSKE